MSKSSNYGRGAPLNHKGALSGDVRSESPATGSGIQCAFPADMPRYKPTIQQRQAADGRTVPDESDRVFYDAQSVRSRGACPVIKLTRGEIPHYSPTAEGVSFEDGRAPRQGHCSLIQYGPEPPLVTILPTANPPLERGNSAFVWENPVLYSMHGGKRYRLANFYVEIIKKYHLIGRDSSMDWIRVRYTSTNDHSVEIDMPVAKFIKGVYSELISQHPEFRLYSDSGRHLQLFREYCSELFEVSVGMIEWESYFLLCGWHERHGTPHYYSALDENCLSNRMLARLDGVNLGDLAMYGHQILSIADLEVMLPILLAMHYGPTRALFEDGGHHDNFIFLIIAPTGSGKSYVARTFFTYFGGGFINFEATDRAIELEIANRMDAVCVIDDLKSGRDKEAGKKVEHVVRQVGDSIGRKKSVKGGMEQEQVCVRTCVIITAEDDLDELQPSGKYRTLAVHIRQGDLPKSGLLKRYHDDVVLAHNAKELALLDYYMTAYIRFLEEHYKRLVAFIARMDVDIPPLQPRQATIYKILVAQAWIVLNFWQWCRMLASDEGDRILQEQWIPALRKILLSNEQRGKVMDPVILFLRAVSEGVASRRLAVAENRRAFEDSADKLAGYWEVDVLKLLPDIAFEFVCKHCAGLGIKFAETQTGILDKLHSKGGILDVYEQKGHKAKLLKSVKLRGTSTRILCIRWKAVEELLLKADSDATAVYN